MHFPTDFQKSEIRSMRASIRYSFAVNRPKLSDWLISGCPISQKHCVASKTNCHEKVKESNYKKTEPKFRLKNRDGNQIDNPLLMERDHIV